MQKLTILALVAVIGYVVAAPSTSYRRRGSEEITDPVEKRARANYAKVVEELNNRFEGYLENCFPRPKGCLCTIGYDANRREITERRRNDADCKRRKDDKADGA